MELKSPIIRNSRGEPITLSTAEKYNVKYMANSLYTQYGPLSGSQHLVNSLGYEVQITTLTTISKRVSEQKFFQVQPSKYIPIVVGQGTWSTNITTYRSFDVADAFETGIINTGGGNARLASVDAGVDALNIKVFPWAKSLGYSIFDLEFAAKSGNWDLVAAKQKSMKRNWDLGIQRIAFLGASGNNGASGQCLGLLNQPGITNNKTIITQPISAMTPSQLKTFCATVVEAYRSNNNRTCYPSSFVIPESDYNGLASQASADFPIKSTLQLLEEMFQVICQNPNFKILSLAYADQAYSGFGYQIYTLLNYDEESLVMNVPLDYYTTLAGSLDNFSFQSAGLGQFTGVLALRPLELMYFTY